MALSEKNLTENPENYITSTYFYSNLYGIDPSNNVDKLYPWEMGIECLTEEILGYVKILSSL